MEIGQDFGSEAGVIILEDPKYLEDPRGSFHMVGHGLVWVLLGSGGAAGISTGQAAQLPLQPVPFFYVGGIALEPGWGQGEQAGR